MFVRVLVCCSILSFSFPLATAIVLQRGSAIASHPNGCSQNPAPTGQLSPRSIPSSHIFEARADSGLAARMQPDIPGSHPFAMRSEVEMPVLHALGLARRSWQREHRPGGKNKHPGSHRSDQRANCQSTNLNLPRLLSRIMFPCQKSPWTSTSWLAVLDFSFTVLTSSDKA